MNLRRFRREMSLAVTRWSLPASSSTVIAGSAAEAAAGKAATHARPAGPAAITSERASARRFINTSWKSARVRGNSAGCQLRPAAEEPLADGGQLRQVLVRAPAKLCCIAAGRRQLVRKAAGHAVDQRLS